MQVGACVWRVHLGYVYVLWDGHTLSDKCVYGDYVCMVCAHGLHVCFEMVTSCLMFSFPHF